MNLTSNPKFEAKDGKARQSHGRNAHGEHGIKLFSVAVRCTR